MNELSRAQETSSQIVTSIQSSMMINWGQNAYEEGTLELVQLSASWRLRRAQARESRENWLHRLEPPASGLSQRLWVQKARIRAIFATHLIMQR